MADFAFQTQFRDEFVAGFEVGMSKLATTVTRRSQIKGNVCTFLVADSGGATASTRGITGDIPARPDNLNQQSTTLVEKHDKSTATDFNIFASQGDRRQIMQMTTMKVINRTIDLDILAEMANATVTTGAAQTATLTLLEKARTKLGNNDVEVEDEDNMFLVCSPAFMAYLRQIPEFTSNDYVEMQPLVGPTRRMLRWNGLNIVDTSLITGKGTAAELCYMYHRNAIGHAVDTRNIMTEIGWEGQNKRSWCVASYYGGTKLLQTNGIVKITHDASAIS